MAIASVAAGASAVLALAKGRAAPGVADARGDPGVSVLCTTTPAAQPDYQSEMAQVMTDMHVAMHVPPSGDIDRDFARMMIPHHQGAIDMARVFLKFGRDQRLRRLAQAIIVEQGQEIAYMRSLLETPA